MNISMQKPNIIIGYTTRKHLLLDLDNTTFNKAEYIIKLIQKKWSKVGDCLIMQSSTNKSGNNRPIYDSLICEFTSVMGNYHLIFDNYIGYNLCCKIIETLATLDILNADYVKIRTLRGDMTLRVSPIINIDGTKHIPINVGYICNNHLNRADGGIRDYLNLFRICRSLFT